MSKQIIYIKGQGIIEVNDQTVDLNKIGKAIALPIDDLDIIEFKSIKKAVTIENYTIFFYYIDNDALIMMH